MKTIKLCREGSCCPSVTITDKFIYIGEGENKCILTIEQWEILKEKILSNEI